MLEIFVIDVDQNDYQNGNRSVKQQKQHMDLTWNDMDQITSDKRLTNLNLAKLRKHRRARLIKEPNSKEVFPKAI